MARSNSAEGARVQKRRGAIAGKMWAGGQGIMLALKECQFRHAVRQEAENVNRPRQLNDSHSTRPMWRFNEVRRPGAFAANQLVACDLWKPRKDPLPIGPK